MRDVTGMQTGRTDPPELDGARRILEERGLLGDGSETGSGRTDVGEQLIPILQDIQDAYGYLPQAVLTWVSEATGIPASRIYGVITFYSHFSLKPRGKHPVKVCRGTACHVKGATEVAEAIEEHLGVLEGETTDDGLFTYESVQCLGTCFLAPVLMVGNEYHGGLKRSAVKKTLARYR